MRKFLILEVMCPYCTVRMAVDSMENWAQKVPKSLPGDYLCYDRDPPYHPGHHCASYANWWTRTLRTMKAGAIPVLLQNLTLFADHDRPRRLGSTGSCVWRSAWYDCGLPEAQATGSAYRAGKLSASNSGHRRQKYWVSNPEPLGQLHRQLHLESRLL
jgi:hypothetical protein